MSLPVESLRLLGLGLRVKGLGRTYSLHCSSFFGYQFYGSDPITSIM